MSLKLLLLASFLLTSPSACTRIIKHYHYHFGFVTFPTSSWNLNLDAVVKEYMFDTPTVSDDERRYFDRVRDYAANFTVKQLLEPDFVEATSYFANLSCADAVPMVGKVVVVKPDVGSWLLKECQRIYDSFPDSGRRRLIAGREPKSNHKQKTP